MRNRRTSALAKSLLLAGILTGAALPTLAQAQSDARWNALYDRIIRLEHEMKAMKRSYERRIRQLEQQLRAARGNGTAPARRATPPAPPPARGSGRQGNADDMFAPLPPLQEPQLSIELEPEDNAPEQVLGRLQSSDLPTATTGQPPAPVVRTAPAVRTPPSAASSRSGSGPIPLPGAVTDAVGATAGAGAGAGTGGLAPGRVVVAPLPPVSGASPGTTAPSPAPQPVSIPPALARLSADALLQKARQNFLARRYDQAEQAYRVWLSRFGNDPRAPEARYDLAETLYIQGRFKEAGRLFVQTYQEAPDSRVAPRALLRLGQALRRMGKRAEACKAWQALRERYPESRAARLQAPRELKRNKCKG